MSEIEQLSEHKKFFEHCSSYEDLYNDLEKVLEQYNDLVFPHEKVAALETLKNVIILSECVEIE